MPANLPPDYYAAERRYREASDAREKVQLLREMLAIMPKHKGTEHLQGDLKKRIAKLQGLAQKKQAGELAKLLPGTAKQIERLANLNRQNQTAKINAKGFVNPDPCVPIQKPPHIP